MNGSPEKRAFFMVHMCGLLCCHQSFYIEAAQGAILMEQKLRFRLDLGQLAILKKNWVCYEQILRAFFHSFHGQKRILIFNIGIVASKLNSCIITFL